MRSSFGWRTADNHRTVLWSLASSIWSAGIGLLLVPVYLRHLGTEAYGLVGFVIALQAWFQILDLGLAPTATREAARHRGGALSDASWRNLWFSMERLYLVITAAITLALWIGAPVLASHWLNLATVDIAAATESIRLLSAALGLQWIGTLYRGALNGGNQQLWLAGCGAGIATARGALTLCALIWIAPTLQVFAACQLAAAIAESGLLKLRVAQIVPSGARRFSVSALRRVWHFAGILAVVSILATAQQHLDKLILSAMLPLEQFAWITLAATLGGALSIAIGPVFNIASPRLAELLARADPTSVGREYHRQAQLAAIATLPVAATLVGFSSEVIGAWTGDAVLIRELSPIVSVWIIGSAINALMHIPYALQLAYGWVRPALIMNVLALGLHIGILLTWIPLLGPMAGAIAWLAVNVLYLTVGMFWIHRKVLPAHLGRWYLHDALLPTVAVALTAGMMRLIANHWPAVSRPAMAAWVCGTLLTCLLAAFVTLPEVRRTRPHAARTNSQDAKTL